MKTWFRFRRNYSALCECVDGLRVYTCVFVIIIYVLSVSLWCECAQIYHTCVSAQARTDIGQCVRSNTFKFYRRSLLSFFFLPSFVKLLLARIFFHSFSFLVRVETARLPSENELFFGLFLSHSNRIIITTFWATGKKCALIFFRLWCVASRCLFEPDSTCSRDCEILLVPNLNGNHAKFSEYLTHLCNLQCVQVSSPTHFVSLPSIHFSFVWIFLFGLFFPCSFHVSVSLWPSC